MLYNIYIIFFCISVYFLVNNVCEANENEDKLKERETQVNELN